MSTRDLWNERDVQPIQYEPVIRLDSAAVLRDKLNEHALTAFVLRDGVAELLNARVAAALAYSMLPYDDLATRLPAVLNNGFDECEPPLSQADFPTVYKMYCGAVVSIMAKKVAAARRSQSQPNKE
jgi:hypothetical protein